jgi:hypothetical protein
MAALSFNVPAVVAPSGDSFLMPDGKKLYITGHRCTTIHEYDLDAKPPRPRLIFTHPRNPKSITGKAGAGAVHADYRVHTVWRDPASGRLCCIDEGKDGSDPKCFRFSEDKTSVELLDIVEMARGSFFALSDGTPAVWDGLPGEKSHQIHILELRGNRVEISETVILPGVEFHFSPPRAIDRLYGGSRHCGFDRAGDGTCYALALEGRIYQRLPGRTAWKHFAGVGSPQVSPVRDGPPLTLGLSSDMAFSAGPNGDVLVCYGGRYNNFYLTKDGKKSFHLPGGHADLATTVRWNYADASIFYLTMARTIDKVQIPQDILARTQATEGVPPLSSLLQSHPEISDAFVELKDGSKLQVHHCILAARCPQLLKWLETRPDVDDSTLRTILRYIYDGEVPSDIQNEIPPLGWIPLGEVASTLSLAKLASRCQEAFGRALFYADPEVCISTLISVARMKNNASLLSQAQSVILARREILIDRAHLLIEHPAILAWFTSKLASHDFHPSTLEELELDSPTSDPADSTLYLSEMSSLLDKSAMTDMVIGSVPCHRAVLVPRCPFVATSLSSGFVEQTSFVIKLSDKRITESVVRRLLRYLYTLAPTTDVLGDAPDELADILELADFLQLHAHVDLIDFCQTQIQTALAEEEPRKPKAPKRRTKREPTKPGLDQQKSLVGTEGGAEPSAATAKAAEAADDDAEAPRAPKRRKR